VIAQNIGCTTYPELTNVTLRGVPRESHFSIVAGGGSEDETRSLQSGPFIRNSDQSEFVDSHRLETSVALIATLLPLVRCSPLPLSSGAGFQPRFDLSFIVPGSQ
jgi:hypothetical protein